MVYDETNEAIIIDAGCYNAREQEVVNTFVEHYGLQVKLLINTHCHIDHVFGVDALKKLYGASFMAHADDLPLLGSLAAQAAMFGVDFGNAPVADATFDEGSTVKFGNSGLRVIHTPGHTKGGVCFYSEKDGVVFTGDTLFCGSVGRTDLPGGSYEDIINSVTSKLFVLPANVVVYPGHGDSTTIGYEKENNPFFR